MTHINENWAIFKTNPWTVGRPTINNEWITIEIGITEWLVSDHGNITRKHIDESGQLKGQYNVNLHWKGRPTSPKMLGIPTGEYVHRLVAMAFVPNPEGYNYVKHLDEDRTNNSASNLVWTKTARKPSKQEGRKERSDKGQQRKIEKN